MVADSRAGRYAELRAAGLTTFGNALRLAAAGTAAHGELGADVPSAAKQKLPANVRL
jgi:hypothetical protein